MGLESQENPRYSPKNRLPPEDVAEFANAKLPARPAAAVDESSEYPEAFFYHAYAPRVSDPPAQRFVEHFNPQRLSRNPRAQYFFHDFNEHISNACQLAPVVLGSRPYRLSTQNLINHSALFSITMPEDSERTPHVGVVYQFRVAIKDRVFSIIPDLDGIRSGNPQLLAPAIVTSDPLLILAHTPLSELDSASPRLYFREIVSRRALNSMVAQFNKWADNNMDALIEPPLSRSSSLYPYQLLGSIMRPVLENAIMRTFEIRRDEYSLLRDREHISVMAASISPSKKNFPATVLIERTDRLKDDGVTSEIFQFDFLLHHTRPGRVTCMSLAPGVEIDSSDNCR